MRLLARREYFTSELRSKLLDLGWPQAEVDDAITHLSARGLLSDERAAEAWAAHYSGKRAVSQQRLAEILAAKGGASVTVPGSTAVDDEQRAREALAAKFKARPDPTRAARFLASRGFEAEVVAAVVEALETE